MKIFDTHTHDQFFDFDNDRDKMLEDDFNAGVLKKIQIGCDESTSLAALWMAKNYKNCYCSVGLHPCNIGEQKESEHYISSISKNFQNIAITIDDHIIAFDKMIQDDNSFVVGIGETGLDFFHRDFSELRILQSESFLKHCQLAKKHNKTLIIHTRNARTETLSFLNTNNAQLPKKAVIHCFSEDFEFAQKITQEYEYMIGIGGVATYKKSEIIRDAIKKTPLKYILTETDAPYLAPQSVRGKRNQSKYIIEIIQCIAEIKNITPEKCSEILFENAIKTFL